MYFLKSGRYFIISSISTSRRAKVSRYDGLQISFFFSLTDAWFGEVGGKKWDWEKSKREFFFKN